MENRNLRLTELYQVQLNSSQQINEMMINFAITETQKLILQPLLQVSEQFFMITTKSSFQSNILNFKSLVQCQPQSFSNQISKLDTILQFFPFAITMNKNDILCLPKESPQWKQIEPHVSTKVLATREQIQNSFKNIKKGILSAVAMTEKKSECKNNFWGKYVERKLIHSFGPLYYMIDTKSGEERAKNFQADPRSDLAISIWNIGEKGMIKTMLPIIFDRIAFNRKIYVPRFFKPIDLPFILFQYEKGLINQINKNPSDLFSQQPKILRKQEILVKHEPHERVQIRILCHEKLVWSEMVHEPKKKRKNQHRENIFEKIIIHVHGGGFVAMSSRQHQSYTRKWANNLKVCLERDRFNVIKVPVFSIDYRKAPKDPYPASLDDCWQAYLWIINYAPIYFNIHPSKIILAGDSAGGNLVAAIAIQCIKENIRVPDALMLCYPALNLDIKFFTPSFLVSLEDTSKISKQLVIVLPHKFLKICLSSYLKDNSVNPKIDPLISPSKLSFEIAYKFPKTRIMTGTGDPLHDECWRFIEKLMYIILNSGFTADLATETPKCQSIQTCLMGFSSLMLRSQE